VRPVCRLSGEGRVEVKVGCCVDVGVAMRGRWQRSEQGRVEGKEGKREYATK